MDAVYGYIESNQDRFVEELRRLVRQPSISAHGLGMVECAELVERTMEDIGIQAQVMPTEGYPLVFGQIGPELSPKTLLLTSHYDVQPPEPLDAWICDPFAAELREGKLIGRGATDSKGNLLSLLRGVEALRRVRGELPLGVKFLFDGEEECGSPSLPKFVKGNKQLLAADAVLTFDGGLDGAGRGQLILGSGGILYLDLKARGSTKDLRGNRARLVPNAAWKLIQALSTLKDSNERVLIDGFYDDLLPPTEEERRLLAEYPWDNQRELEASRVHEFLGGVQGREAVERLLVMPTCNIDGIASGYSGPGVKTVLPSQAMAKVEFGLRAAQPPEDILRKLRAHLNRKGFGELEVEVLASTEPALSSTDSLISRAALAAWETVYGAKPAVKPRAETYGRQGTWLARQLCVEGAMIGVGPPAWNGHAPNEFMTIEHLIKGLKYAATVIDIFAKSLS